MEALDRDFIIKTMERAAQRAMARVLEYEDPVLEPTAEELPKAERDKYLALLERDYAVFATVREWIDKYVPAFETCQVTSDLLARKHAEYDMRHEVAAAADNIINLSDYRKG